MEQAKNGTDWLRIVLYCMMSVQTTRSPIPIQSRIQHVMRGKGAVSWTLSLAVYDVEKVGHGRS